MAYDVLTKKYLRNYFSFLKILVSSFEKQYSMYITELSAIIGKEIEVTKYREGKEKYQAKLSGIEAREGNSLSGVWEAGATPKEAIKNYCKAISNQFLIANAYGEYDLRKITVTAGTIKRSDYLIIRKKTNLCTAK